MKVLKKYTKMITYLFTNYECKTKHKSFPLVQNIPNL